MRTKKLLATVWKIGRQCIASVCALCLVAGQGFVLAQSESASSGQTEAAKITSDQLDSLVAPIALYPDPIYHIRQSGQRLDAGIPRFFCNGIGERLVFQAFVFREPLLQLDG
jgi:hypothetical protein